MSIVTARPIRLKCDLASPHHVRDERTGLPPVAVRGAALNVQCGLFVQTAIVDDKSNYDAATLKIRELSSDGVIGDVAVSAAVAGAALTDCNAAAWAAGSGQHAQFALTTAQLTLAAGEYWLVICGETAAGEIVVWAAGKIRVADQGVTDAAASAPEFLPSDGPTCKRGAEVLIADAETATISFVTEFASAPSVVLPSLLAPSAAAGVAVWLDGAPTAAGFTVRFGAPIPSSGYSLHWVAFL